MALDYSQAYIKEILDEVKTIAPLKKKYPFLASSKSMQKQIEFAKKKIDENIDKYRDNVIYCCKTLDNDNLMDFQHDTYLTQSFLSLCIPYSIWVLKVSTIEWEQV